jgi:nucleoporin NUP82
VPSPSEDLLAIATEHTVHVCLIPDSSHLDQPDTGPIRPKIQMLGPTIHVSSQARVVSVLWHPLGVGGHCLVTVTSDAVVRLWELSMDNRWTFEEPTLALDLRKLRNARSSEDKVHPERLGENKGFSYNAVGMEVASVCFGGTGDEDESGWSAMTLWIAMTEGFVFALCPLLPTKWQPSSTSIQSLTSSIFATRGTEEGDDGKERREKASAQLSWLSEIDQEIPIIAPGKTEFSPEVPIYHRPKKTVTVPKLQGPFTILPGELEEELNITAIHVIAPKLEAIDVIDSDQGEFLEGHMDSIPSSFVCLLTREGRVYVCLDLEGIDGEWLPNKQEKTKSREAVQQPELLVIEALDTIKDHKRLEECWPSITPDIHSRYAFFVTHGDAIYYFSIEDWICKLEDEFLEDYGAGTGFRLKLAADTSHTLREELLRFPYLGASQQPSTAVILQDSDLGYFLLTSRQNRPFAIILDSPEVDAEEDDDEDEGVYALRESSIPKLIANPPRLPYEPDEAFTKSLNVAASLANLIKGSRIGKKDEIRLSPATLEAMTHAHRIMSSETHKLGVAVSELFTRCEVMRSEFSNQIQRVREISAKIDGINDEDEDYDNNDLRGSNKLDKRLQDAQTRQKNIIERYEALRKKAAKASGRPLSDKEQGWVREVDKIAKELVPSSDDEDENREGKECWRRFQQVCILNFGDHG